VFERQCVHLTPRCVTEIEAWRIDYNEHRPHGSLGDLTPQEFAEQAVQTGRQGARIFSPCGLVFGKVSKTHSALVKSCLKRGQRQVYLVLVLDWYTKKIAGHYAGLQAQDIALAGRARYGGAVPVPRWKPRLRTPPL